MQQKTSRSRFVALAVIPAVASSVGTYAITRAMYERPPVRVIAATSPAPQHISGVSSAAVAPLSLDAYVFPDARKQGTSRSGDLESREYETDASISKVAQYYRQQLAPSIQIDYSRIPINGSFSSSSSNASGQFSANGRININTQGSGNAIFFRRDAAGVLTIVAAGHKGEKTTIVTSYTPANW